MSVDDMGRGTGVCAAIICNKERSLVADLGAALHFPSSTLENNLPSIFSSQLIYGTGFFLTSNAPALQVVAEKAGETG